MEQMENLLSYLTAIESLVRDLDRRVTDLSEIELTEDQCPECSSHYTQRVIKQKDLS